jgi:hypothetical protein
MRTPVSSSPNTLERIDAHGVLLIGDPHASSRRPGRRCDEDFIETVVGKLAQAIAIANEERLVPIILGDLLDTGNECDIRLLTCLTRCLRAAWITPWYLLGNHTLTIGRRATHQALSDDHTLSLLLEAGTVRRLSDTGRPCLLTDTPGGSVVIGGIGWGRKIPAQADEAWAPLQGAIKVLVTHHDLAFPGAAIPKALALTRVVGIDLVVNGHMHDTLLPRRVGNTWYFNPGNITRMSIDLEGHIPSVFSLVPGRADVADEHLAHPLPFGLRRHVLTHRTAIFDHTGRRIDAVAPSAMPEPRESSFVNLLRQEAELPRTADGSVFLEEMRAVFAELEVDPAIQNMLEELALEEIGRVQMG